MKPNPPLITGDIGALPVEIRTALSAPELVDLFSRFQYYEDIRNSWVLKPAIDQIEQYSLKNGLAVYHCAKELFPGKFATEGLRVLDHQRHVTEFLQYAMKETLLDEREREEIEPILRTWRDGTTHEQARDGTLHFIHSRQEVCNWGAEKFFRYYGGESLYWPFGPWSPSAADHWFLKILESIGVPVVVESRVAPSDLITGSQNSGADIVISYFARSVNPDFRPWEPFCLTKKSVSPAQIMSVTPLDSFVERFDLELDWEWNPQWSKRPAL
jgi:hypothetical protein